MKHTKRCGGRLVTFVERRVMLSSGHERVTVECERCGEWFPFGPSDEAQVAVALELRAAKIAAGPPRMSPNERDGWMAYGRGAFPCRDDAASVTGYLAHAIAHHDEEQAAGQALSDGGTTEGA